MNVAGSQSPSGADSSAGEVLTLPEVAAYLRVSEDAVRELASRDALPAQLVGTEWRFSKHAVTDWLRLGAPHRREFPFFPPPWALARPFWEELVADLEQRILRKVAADHPTAKPGSKAAVLKHFGVFQGDGDADQELARIRARREADGE